MRTYNLVINTHTRTYKYSLFISTILIFLQIKYEIKKTIDKCKHSYNRQIFKESTLTYQTSESRVCRHLLNLKAAQKVIRIHLRDE